MSITPQAFPYLYFCVNYTNCVLEKGEDGGCGALSYAEYAYKNAEPTVEVIIALNVHLSGKTTAASAKLEETTPMCWQTSVANVKQWRGWGLITERKCATLCVKTAATLLTASQTYFRADGRGLNAGVGLVEKSSDRLFKALKKVCHLEFRYVPIISDWKYNTLTLCIFSCLCPDLQPLLLFYGSFSTSFSLQTDRQDVA